MINAILQAHTHVHLDIGQSGLVASFVPDGMDACYERSNQMADKAIESGSRTLAVIALTDRPVFTGTLGLALCNPLTDGIQALSYQEAAEGANVHRPGFYTQRLVIGDNPAVAGNEGH